MLILDRLVGSSLLIGDTVKVQVQSIRKRAAKLAIDAPSNVAIIREELVGPCEPADPPERAALVAGPRPRILVIEDNLGHRKIIEGVLSRIGKYDIELYETAADGIAAACRSDAPTPTLILVDFRLPDLTGLQVVAMLRHIPSLKKSAVVMLSSCDDPTCIDQCTEAGANAFMQKSVSFAEMEESLRQIAGFWCHRRLVG